MIYYTQIMAAEIPPATAHTRYWVGFFTLTALQSAAALAWTAALPSDGQGALLGFSSARLVLLAILAALTVLAGLSARFVYRRGTPSWLLRDSLQDIIFVGGIFVALAVPLLLNTLTALARQGEIFRYAAYASRLRPALLAAALCGVEVALLITWLRRERLPALTVLLHKASTPWAISATAGFVLFTFILITRIGLTPATIGSWGDPAVPFLEWQIALIWLISMGAILIGLLRNKTLPPNFDRAAVLVIWAASAALWLSQPITPGFFATAPRPPAFELYPFSDALTYAQNAQSILAGVTWQGDIPARPLYVTLLAGLHALAGQDYQRVIAVQTLLLAFFPALLYLIGKELGSRPLGLAAAALTVLRDITANLSAPFALNLTYSKLYFSELPTALLLSLAVFCLLRWLNHSAKNPVLPLAAGGAVGLAMLIRTQSAIVLPACLLVIFLYQPKNWRQWLSAALLAGLGVALAIAPWLVRNAHLTGGLVFDHPASQTLVIAQRYNGLNFDDPIPMLQEETLSGYSGRLLKMAADGFFNNPVTSLKLAAANWFNNFIANLLILPLRSDLESLSELIRPTRAFWQAWQGSPTPLQTVVLGIYLLVFTSGVAQAWRLRGWAGLLPLALNLSYNLWTGLFLSSGDRFLVPADWGFYLYLILGLNSLGTGLFYCIPRLNGRLLSRLNTTPEPDTINTPSIQRRVWSLPLTAIVIFLCGAAVPWSETAVNARYQPFNSPQTRHELLQSAAALPESQAIEVVRLAALPEIEIEHGRTIYPRYYAAGEGEPETAKTGYAPGPAARLVFPFLGASNHLVIFEMDQTPLFFPHTADVFLFYQQESDRQKPAAILVVKDGRAAFYNNEKKP